MAAQALTVDWGVLVPVVIATAGPTITGFLQQYSKTFSEKAPWYAKAIITAAISALIGMITSYAASGDALLSATGGAIVGAIGSMNIALRKGSRSNLEVIIATKTDTPAEPVK